MFQLVGGRVGSTRQQSTTGSCPMFHMTTFIGYQNFQNNSLQGLFIIFLHYKGCPYPYKHKQIGVFSLIIQHKFQSYSYHYLQTYVMIIAKDLLLVFGIIQVVPTKKSIKIGVFCLMKYILQCYVEVQQQRHAQVDTSSWNNVYFGQGLQTP